MRPSSQVICRVREVASRRPRALPWLALFGLAGCIEPGPEQAQSCLERPCDAELTCVDGECVDGQGGGGAGGQGGDGPCAHENAEIVLGCPDQVEIRGEGEDNLGTALAAADLDGDGSLDLIASAPSAASGTGAVWLLFGPFEPGSVLSLPSPSRPPAEPSPRLVRIAGPMPGARFGESLAIGRFDDDELPDLLVGGGGPDVTARAYLFRNPGLPACGLDCTTALADASYSAGLGELRVAAAALFGPREQPLLAWSGDDEDPRQRGSVFVVNGLPSIEAYGLAGAAERRGGIDRSEAADGLGTAMGDAGAFLGAGTESVAIGAPGQDRVGESDGGGVYLLSLEELAANGVAGSAGRRVVPGQSNLGLGSAFAAGAFFSGSDGRDLAIGARGDAGKTGRIFLLPGR